MVVSPVAVTRREPSARAVARLEHLHALDVHDRRAVRSLSKRPTVTGDRLRFVLQRVVPLSLHQFIYSTLYSI